MEFRDLFTDEENIVRQGGRSFVEDQGIPIIERQCCEGVFPIQLLKPMAKLGYLGTTLQGDGCANLKSSAYELLMQELERGDTDPRSFVSVQSALVVYPIYRYGYYETARDWALERR